MLFRSTRPEIFDFDVERMQGAKRVAVAGHEVNPRIIEYGNIIRLVRESQPETTE